MKQGEPMKNEFFGGFKYASKIIDIFDQVTGDNGWTTVRAWAKFFLDQRPAMSGNQFIDVWLAWLFIQGTHNSVAGPITLNLGSLLSTGADGIIFDALADQTIDCAGTTVIRPASAVCVKDTANIKIIIQTNSADTSSALNGFPILLKNKPIIFLPDNI